MVLERLIAMSQLGEAIARYHKILKANRIATCSGPKPSRRRCGLWRLVSGNRPISPVLRPHFITKRQYANLVKAAESLDCAIHRVETMALSNPQLLNRMQLLPAEKMLAAVDPGYPFTSVTSLLDTYVNNGTLRFVDYNADTPAGVAFGEALDGVFYDSQPMKEFRRSTQLRRLAARSTCCRPC